MASLLTTENVVFVLGVLGVIFSVYRYFRDPQVASEKKDALLAQQVQWAKEGADTRFKDMQESFQSLLLQSNNHIHTVDTKVDKVAGSVATMAIEVAKLTTIIEERIPRKS